MQLYNNDALIVLKALPENCIDLIVTDPLIFGLNHVHGLT